MNARLVYVVGPSGVGKDSLLDWLKAHMPQGMTASWARRTIDRPIVAGGEAHESVTTSEFQSLLSAQAFALHWQANGHAYGIRHEQLTAQDESRWIFVNGSREHVSTAAASYPGLTVLHVTADQETLRQRLSLRARETTEEIEQRLNRHFDLKAPEGCELIEIQNTTELAKVGEQLLKVLISRATLDRPLRSTIQ